VLGIAASGAAVLQDRRERQREIETADPDGKMRHRVDVISFALRRSAASLSEASVLIAELQEELTGRVAALDDLRQEIKEHQELAKISGEATKALDQAMAARLREQERRIARVAWKQGAIFAVFGAAIAIALVVFGHLIPAIN